MFIVVLGGVQCGVHTVLQHLHDLGWIIALWWAPYRFLGNICPKDG